MAGMCCTQLARIDHMCKNIWTRGRRKLVQGIHMRSAGDRWAPAAAHSLTNYGLAPLFWQF
jgi:hypothetical protein